MDCLKIDQGNGFISYNLLKSVHTLLSKNKVSLKRKKKKQKTTRLSFSVSKEWPSLVFECNATFEHWYGPLPCWSLLVTQLKSPPSSSAHGTWGFHLGSTLLWFKSEGNSSHRPVAVGLLARSPGLVFPSAHGASKTHLAYAFPGEDLCVHTGKTFPGHEIFISSNNKGTELPITPLGCQSKSRVFFVVFCCCCLNSYYESHQRRRPKCATSRRGKTPSIICRRQLSFLDAGSIILDVQFSLSLSLFRVSVYAVGSVVCTETTHSSNLGGFRGNPNRITVPPKLGKCLQQNKTTSKEQKDSEMVPVIALWGNSA